MEKIKAALREAVKEALRLGLLSIVGFLIQEGVGLIVDVFGGKLTSEQRVMVTGGFIYALRSLDKYLYELGKSTKNESMSLGLTRF